jgi:hypothetical protein
LLLPFRSVLLYLVWPHGFLPKIAVFGGAELFEFTPDLALLFSRTLGIRSMNWQEVVPDIRKDTVFTL